MAYEAGPTGFGLYRHLSAAGIRCEVAAPSKLQRPAGDRVKTDAKDALHLARLLRLDEITSVVVPTVAQEAARDLVRAREDCRGDLMRARHRLSKMLLRHGIVYYDGDAWTGKHDRWLRRQRFTNALTQADLRRPTTTRCWPPPPVGPARRSRSSPMAADSEYTALVRRLGCLRGIATLTGFALAVEIGDWHRFTGNTIGSFVGLVPSEHSSGTSRDQGPITKTGNGHVRRLLVEAAWHHQAPVPARQDHARPLGPGHSRGPGPRRRGQPRLHARWVKFIDRKKKNTIANTAIARELAGWCWSLAVLEE